MANSDKPNGFTPIGTLSGADYHGKMRRVAFAAGDAVAAFVGDLVKLTGTVDATGKIPVVAQSAAGDASIGVLVSLDFDATDEGNLMTPLTRAASTARTGHVLFGQDVLYKIQEDSVGNDIEITEAGLNCNVIVATGSDVTGSAMELDSTSAAGTSTLNVRLHHVYDSPDNALGTNAEWVVSINASQEALNQTGI
jgi:hypothetical protein